MVRAEARTVAAREGSLRAEVGEARVEEPLKQLEHEQADLRLFERAHEPHAAEEVDEQLERLLALRQRGRRAQRGAQPQAERLAERWQHVGHRLGGRLHRLGEGGERMEDVRLGGPLRANLREQRGQGGSQGGG